MRRLFLLPLTLAACAEARQPDVTAQAGAPFQVQPVADFDQPWAMTFLPDGRMLVTEKSGKLLLVSKDGRTRQAVAGTPAVDSEGQGGLMDVVLHPDFANPDEGAVNNRRVYLSFSESGAGGKGVALATGRLIDMDGGPQLDGMKIIFRAQPYVEGDGHYSGRIAFAPDGKLFFTAGERQKFEPAQDKSGHLGKVLRLNDDGTAAVGNPLVRQGFRPEVWSYGHRNLLGLAFDKQGRLWEQEMGPAHGDELNLVKPGLNYGYPRVSNGDHYDGRPIPDHKPGDGYEAPKAYWNPAISPAGLMIYSGKLFRDWRGNAFIGGMNTPGLARVELNGESARKAAFYDLDGQRVREVEEGPDGAIYLLEDGLRGSQGRLLRLTPKQGG